MGIQKMILIRFYKTHENSLKSLKKYFMMLKKPVTGRLDIASQQQQTGDTSHQIITRCNDIQSSYSPPLQTESTPLLQPPAAEPNTFCISISNFAKFRFLDIKTQFHVQINSICIRRLTISVKLKLHNSNMHPQSIFYGGPDSPQAEADLYVICPVSLGVIVLFVCLWQTHNLQY